jgi:peptidase M23-like protein
MAWLAALWAVSRWTARLAPMAALFVVVTALLGPVVEDPWVRLALGVAAVTLPPLAWRKRLKYWTVAPVMDGALAVGLAFGFADDVGRALRRHGDWFIGERNGLVARLLRRGIGGAAGYLEKFDAPPEIVAAAPAFVHPLDSRVLPANESQRFGAARPQPRPAECELGHCGVDLVAPFGSPVHAIAAGVVLTAERDEARGGRAGRYVVIAHGDVKSRYIHLDGVALAVGQHVRAGEVVGTIGRTGIEHSAPHLHFGLQIHDLYVDPEPYLQRWPVTAPPSVAARL